MPQLWELLMSSLKLVYHPAKAANAGGVAVSALEMAQTADVHNGHSEEVDAETLRIS